MWLYTDLPFSFSNLALYSFYKETTGSDDQLHVKSHRLEVHFAQHMRELYPADKLVDLLAVGSVTSLGQGGKGARLHVLLTGLLVFTLRKKINTAVVKKQQFILLFTTVD